MTKIQGPSLFLAQFVSGEPPFNTLDSLAAWAARLGFRAVQLPTSEPRLLDLPLLAESQSYADDFRERLARHGLVASELSTHLQGQLVAVHPAFGELFDTFAPLRVRGNDPARRAWAEDQLRLAARASARLGLAAHATFSGALAWPYVYPWPQRPPGLVEEAFRELARRWLPILDVFDEAGVDLCFELHPGEDLHDGVTFERFLAATGWHPRAKILYDPSHMVLQAMDYLAFLDHYHPFVRAFHVKDAELRPSGRSGVYGGYQGWVERPGRFRTPSFGQVDFGAVFAKLAQYNYTGWAVLEWEDPLQSGEDGARLGAELIRRAILHPAARSFDDFAGGVQDRASLRRILGLGSETGPL